MDPSGRTSIRSSSQEPALHDRSHGPQHQVVRVIRTRTRPHVARPPLVDLDAPAVTEQLGHVRRTHVLGRVEPVGPGLLGIDIGVMNHEQGVPRVRRRRGARSASWPGVRRSAGYCAETSSNTPVGSCASSRPACTHRTCASACRACRAARSSATWDTSRAVTSQPPGQPGRVRAFATTDVERPPRLESGHLCDQRTIGLAGLHADPAPPHGGGVGTAEHRVALPDRRCGERLARVLPASPVALAVPWSAVLDELRPVTAPTAGPQVSVELFVRAGAALRESSEGLVSQRRRDELGDQQRVARAGGRLDLVTGKPLVKEVLERDVGTDGSPVTDLLPERVAA